MIPRNLVVNQQILQIPLKSQVLWVGIGCQRGISSQLIDQAIKKVFQEYQLTDYAIAGFATIDAKASEVGLVEFCHLRNLPLKNFSAEILRTVLVPNPAKIVQETTGTPSVAEASAILAASEFTLEMKLLVPKQIFRLPGQSGAITIAVAQSVN
jgi:cobalamin biosynthesis protein CbiG